MTSMSDTIPPGYHRIKRGRMAADQYTSIRNALFRDARLSAKAMGIFGHISTHQDGYGVTPESISRHMKDGVSAIKGGLRELETCGYLYRERERRQDGTLGASTYYITDEPEAVVAEVERQNPSSEPEDGNRPLASGPENGRSEPTDGNPPVENPLVEKPSVDDHLPKNTNIKNLNSEEPPTNQRGTHAASSELAGSWVVGGLAGDQKPSTPGAVLLASLPQAPGARFVKDLTPAVDALLESGWTGQQLAERWTVNTRGAQNPLGLLRDRIGDTPLKSRGKPTAVDAEQRVDALAKSGETGAREACRLLGLPDWREPARGDQDARTYLLETKPKAARVFVEGHRDELIAALA